MKNFLYSLLAKYGAKALALRATMLFVTSFWFAFYPIYLCIIYMLKEGFFSYDFFVDGVFSLKTFLFVLLVFISVLSINLWGFLFLGQKARLSKEIGKKKKAQYLYCLIALMWSLLLHYVIYQLANTVGEGNVLIGISAIGFVLVTVFVLNLGKSLEEIVLDWKSPFIAVLLSASIPALLVSETGLLVGYALRNFAVGGGVLAKVYANNDHNRLVFCGPLILLTPKNAYLRNGPRQYKLIVISEGISISAKKHHEENDMYECLASSKL